VSPSHLDQRQPERARPRTAIDYQETDFVPYNFHAVPSVWQKVCHHYGLKDTHEAMEFIGNHIVKAGSDFNCNPWADDVGPVEIIVSGVPGRGIHPAKLPYR